MDLDNILTKIEISVYAKAYVKKKSIKENARFIKRQEILLSLDVKKFLIVLHLIRFIKYFQVWDIKKI